MFLLLLAKKARVLDEEEESIVEAYRMADRVGERRASISGNSDAYAILGVQPGCSAKEIRAAFRRKARLLHPDKVLPHYALRDNQTSLRSYRSEGKPSERIATISSSQPCAFQSKSNIECPQVTSCHEAFVTLIEAYKTLLPSQSVSESALIGELRAERNEAIPIKLGKLKSLDDFFPNEIESNDATGRQEVLIFTCRCGDDLIIEKEELREGLDLLECGACSLTYRIVD